MTRILSTITLFLATVCIAWAQVDSAYYYYERSKEALTKSDTIQYYTATKHALRFHPYHPTLIYNAALSASMRGFHEEAFEYLNALLPMNAKVDLNRVELAPLHATERFQQLKNSQHELLVPVIHSDTAMVIKDRSLHIESIAGHNGKFYFGSIHKQKIIERDKKGTVRDFVPSAHEGLCSVFGMKVDVKNNLLWACSSPIPEMEGYDSTLTSAVFCFNLKKRKMIARYEPTRANALLGDLTIDIAGNIFVSDSKNNVIYKVDRKKNVMEEYFTDPELWNLQGLTPSDDGRFLFVADYIKGVYRLEHATKKIVKLQQPSGSSMKSVDGVTFFQNSLIAIQNGITPMRVTRYFLNDSLDEISSFEFIDKAHPAFNEPTIGFVEEDTFYYVANSAWSGYKEGKLKPLDQLQDVVILKVDLKKIN